MSEIIRNLKVGDFNPYVGQEFSLADDKKSIQVQLTEVKPFGPDKELGDECKAFSLLFETEADVIVPQGNYDLSHPKYGKLTLFMNTVRIDGKPTCIEVALT